MVSREDIKEIIIVFCLRSLALSPKEEDREPIAKEFFTALLKENAIPFTFDSFVEECVRLQNIPDFAKKLLINARKTEGLN